ncbi:MAG: dephospho-CoA kinase [bacterium]
MVIGVTGGIGSGKSLFCHEFEKLGAYVIDADKVAKELIDHRKDLHDKLKNTFGEQVFDNNGNLKRRELGRLVFADKIYLQKLNAIMQKPLFQEINQSINKIRVKNNKKIIIIDMAIIFESGAESLFDYIVTIAAPLPLRIKWLQQDRGWTEKEINDRINAQMQVEQKIKKSDFVIQNKASVKNLRSKALRLFNIIKLL